MTYLKRDAINSHPNIEIWTSETDKSKTGSKHIRIKKERRKTTEHNETQTGKSVGSSDKANLLLSQKV